MIEATETFKGMWLFEPHFTDASGFCQHYVDEGPRKGEVILCLHGEPTWDYLYRSIRSINGVSRVTGRRESGRGGMRSWM